MSLTPLLKENYLELITSQHCLRPNYMNVVDGHLELFKGLSDCLNQFDDAFDIDKAVGAQLDILGQLIGTGRILPYQPTDGSSAVLTDDDYRFLLKARIGWNAWDGTREHLVFLWTQQFPTSEIIIDDHGDMTVTLTITFAGLTNSQLDLVENGIIPPRPEGVLYNYIVIRQRTFAYEWDASETELYGGYDQGAMWY